MPKTVNTGPKKPQNSYMYFGHHKRAEIKLSNPTLPMKEVMKLIAEEWKELDAEAKKPFEEQATADKARYASEGGGAASSKPKIPRGPNAYAVFLKEIRPSVVEAEPGLTFGEVGRKVAELWRGMSDGEKDTFKAKAALLKPGASDE